MTQGTCETCRFWNYARLGKGACQKSPPTVTTFNVGWVWPKYQVVRAFPEMAESDFCGEHKPKDGK